jgi:hypothetical protein
LLIKPFSAVEFTCHAWAEYRTTPTKLFTGVTTARHCLPVRMKVQSYMIYYLDKLLALILFPFIGVTVILISTKLSWKPTQSRVIDDVQHISSKETIGWMCMSHLITAMLCFFILLWTRINGFAQPTILIFIVGLIINVICTFKFKYAMVSLSNDNLIIKGLIRAPRCAKWVT